MATTITLSEEFRDYLYERKDRDQTYEEYLRTELGVEDEDL